MTKQQHNNFTNNLAEPPDRESAPAVIIIEPAEGTRRLDPQKSQPHSLDRDKTFNKPVMEWLLHALKNCFRVIPTLN